MYKWRSLAVVILPLLSLSCSAAEVMKAGDQAQLKEIPASQLSPSNTHKKLAMILTNVVGRYHYRKIPLDDGLSRVIFNRYLEMLDPTHSYFLQSDIDRFAIYAERLDDALKNAQLDPAFEIFLAYRARVEEQAIYALNVLSKGFDFTIDENYRINRRKAPWLTTQDQKDGLWRKKVKNDFLTLHLAGQTKEKITAILKRRYERMIKLVRQLRADDIFQIFINAYTLSLEPHTSYIPPQLTQEFGISKEQSLAAIGIVLRIDNEHLMVQSVLPNGSAGLSGQITVGDRIIAIGQGDNGEMENVEGWKMQDAAELIHGVNGSIIRLSLLPRDAGLTGQVLTVTLVRNEVKLKDQAATKFIIEGLAGIGKHRIGVVRIPAFYRDIQAYSEGNESYRSTTSDVRHLLDELVAEGVDGVVVDLRWNGGGAFTEATELTGLFIDKGPVVQVMNSMGKLSIEYDSQAGMAYDGPLAVLVDHDSASASEIFAGAIQDYSRGIIIGEPTFGMGTVQTLIDLNRLVTKNTEQLGRLRLTMGQFFRITGESPQLRGIVPDIELPTGKRIYDSGEQAMENALPWATIKAANYEPNNSIVLTQIKQQHVKRVASDQGFSFLIDEGLLTQWSSDQHLVTLLESSRKSEWAQKKVRFREHRNRFRRAHGLTTISEIDKNTYEADQSFIEEAKIINRIMIDEAARILVDYIKFSDPNSSIAKAEKLGEGGLN